jgi:hypothetical protein
MAAKQFALDTDCLSRLIAEKPGTMQDFCGIDPDRKAEQMTIDHLPMPIESMTDERFPLPL